MNADELRARQAPLKTRYRETPEAAVVTLAARGRVDVAAQSCITERAHPGAPAGLHPATGGDGMFACSGDMLLESLVACAGVTLAAVATAMALPVTSATLTAFGD